MSDIFLTLTLQYVVVSHELYGLQPWSMRTVSCIKSWSLLEEIWTEYFLSKWFPVLFNILWLSMIHKVFGIEQNIFCFLVRIWSSQRVLSEVEEVFFSRRNNKTPQKNCGKAVSHVEHKQFQCPAQLQKCQPCRLRLKWHRRGQGDRQLAMQLEIVASKLAL